MPRMKFLFKVTLHLMLVYAVFALIAGFHVGWEPYWWDARTWGVFSLFYLGYIALTGGYVAEMTVAHMGWRCMDEAKDVVLERAARPSVSPEGHCLGCNPRALEENLQPTDQGASLDINMHSEGCGYRKAVIWAASNGYTRCAYCEEWDGQHHEDCQYPQGWRGPTVPKKYL